MNSLFLGTLTAIIGPSGSGKTTLLNALAGRSQHKLAAGTLTINGKPFTKSTFRKISGYVIQEDLMLEHLTAREVFDINTLLNLKTTYLSDIELLCKA